VDENLSYLLVSVAVLSESSLEKIQLTDAAGLSRGPTVYTKGKTADILASGDGNRN
jgi:hypothetical protein